MSIFTEGPRLPALQGDCKPCGPSGGSQCTGMDEYYPTVILMVLVWFAGLILAGGVWLSSGI